MLEVRNLTKVYLPKKGVPQTALNKVSVSFPERGMVFILGKSGSGKSTLLNLLGGLDSYDGGEIIIKGKSSKNFKQSEFDSYRNTYVGFIFQEYNVLDEFSVAKNIGLALELQHKAATAEAVGEILEQVDLLEYADRKPNELSGGQKQRVAIARALIKKPQIIMADEPSGALDSATGKQIFDTLKKLSQDKLVLVVTHDRETADRYGDRIIELADGVIISDISKTSNIGGDISDFQIVDDEFILIRKGYQLKAEDIEKLNLLLSGAPGDTVILSDQKLGTEIKAKKGFQENDALPASFKNTTQENIPLKKYGEGDFQLIKSRLPIKDSFKMGASALKHKVVRLCFAIFLSFISFALFALFDTVGSYDSARTTLNSMRDTKVNHLGIVKQSLASESSYGYFRHSDFTESDVEMLKERFPTYSFQPYYSITNEWGGVATLDFYDFFYDQIKSNDRFHSASVSAFYEPESLSGNGVTLMGGSRLPQNETEAVIPKYILEGAMKYGYKEISGTSVKKVAINSADDIIGKKISFDNDDLELTIVGVSDTHTDTSRYNDLKDISQNMSDADQLLFYILSEELNLIKATQFGAFILYPGTSAKYFFTKAKSLFLQSNSLNAYITAQEYRDNIVPIFLNGQTSFSASDLLLSFNALSNAYQMWGTSYNFIESYYTGYIKPFLTAHSTEIESAAAGDAYYFSEYKGNFNSFTNSYVNTLNSKLDSYLKTGTIAPAAMKTFLDSSLTADTLHNMLISFIETTFPPKAQYSVNMDNSSTTYCSLAAYYTPLKAMPASLTAVERFFTSNLGASKSYYHKDLPNVLGVAESEAYCTGLFTDIKLNNSDLPLIRFLFEADKSDKFMMTGAVSYYVYMADEMLKILGQVFFWIAFGFMIFACILLMNFLTASIINKKREIGVLRAIGARSSDVFMIFFCESLIIGAINFVLSAIATLIASFYLNMLLRSTGILISIFNFGIRQVIVLLGISLIVAFVSTFLPVYKFSKKKPIDAIRDR